MHIAYNGYFWDKPHTGSGQYLRQLIIHLRQIVSDLQMTLVFPQTPDSLPPSDVPAAVECVSVPIRSGHLGKVKWEQIDFPRACRQLAADIAHVPYWGSPLQSPVPMVVTVHDIITHIIPEYRRSATARLYNALVTASAKGANHLITDSHASKRDMVDKLSIPAEQITPIHLAVTADYNEHNQLTLDMAIQRKYELPEFYILYLGGYEIHKNVTALLEAYSYVVKALGDEYPLLLAGNKPSQTSIRFPDYDRHIANLGLNDHIYWLGYVNEADKPTLYRHASAFVFPSRYEGFGLPPLEAMACGAPVIATTVSSIPEVVGDAAFAVVPDDARQMGGAIIATLIQDELAAQMRAKGLAQAKRFSWRKTAEETLEIYLKLA